MPDPYFIRINKIGNPPVIEITWALDNQSKKEKMNSLFLALLLISQTPKFQISGGFGVNWCVYHNEQYLENDAGVTFRGFLDYWIKDFLAFGIDSGYQQFDSGFGPTENIFSIPHVKIGTTNFGKNKPFLLIGFGFDAIGMKHDHPIEYVKCPVLNFGAGYMRNFGNFHAGVIFNDLWIRNQDVCGDGCWESIHLPTLSLFLGFGK